MTFAVAGCSTGYPATIPLDEHRAPAEFTKRERLPSCGRVVLQPAQLTPASAISCIDEASSAELVVMRPTTEGDPIVEYYRKVPGVAGLELFIDATRDSYGVRQWTFAACPEALSVVDLGTCSERVL
jgi:hypothetical protein